MCRSGCSTALPVREKPEDVPWGDEVWQGGVARFWALAPLCSGCGKSSVSRLNPTGNKDRRTGQGLVLVTGACQVGSEHTALPLAAQPQEWVLAALGTWLGCLNQFKSAQPMYLAGHHVVPVWPWLLSPGRSNSQSLLCITSL